MKRKRYSVEQIAGILKQAESGMVIGELCRHVGISEQTFYRWKKVYGGMLPSEVRELKQLREENARLKRAVADLTFDKVMLQDVVQKSAEARGSASGRAISDEPLAGQPASGRLCGAVLSIERPLPELS